MQHIGFHQHPPSQIERNEVDHLDQVVLKPLGGEGKQGKEEHVGGRMGDELDKRVSHKFTLCRVRRQDVEEAVDGE